MPTFGNFTICDLSRYVGCVVMITSNHIPRNNKGWMRVRAFVRPIETWILHVLDAVEIEIVANANDEFTLVLTDHL